MRTHARHPALLSSRGLDRLGRLVTAQSLIAARFEPILDQRKDGAILDLTFRSESETAVVPLVYVDVVQLLEREKEPFVWPAALAAVVDDGEARAIARKIEPWLSARSRARLQNDELIRIFGNEADGALFRRARELGFLGAATLATAIREIGPFSYAARFARGKRVLVATERGCVATSILANAGDVVVLRDCHVDPEFSERWYGLTLTPENDALGDFDVIVTDVAGAALVERRSPGAVRVVLDVENDSAYTAALIKPVPTDLLVAFDSEDGPAVRVFSITAPERAALRPVAPLPRAQAVGGSAGRILLVLRNDWKTCPDCDVEEGLELAARLRDEGIEVDIGIESGQLVPGRYDLVHIFGLTTPDLAVRILSAAREQGVRSAVTTSMDDIPAQRWWGTCVHPLLFRIGSDDVRFASLQFKFEQRKLEMDMTTSERGPKLHTPNRRYPPYEAYESDVATVLAIADVVFVNGEAEEAIVRRQFGRTGATVECGTLVPEFSEPESVDELVGADDFVLVHAPLASRCNQLIVARAAMAANLPLVIVGPVAEVDYLDLLRAYTDDRVVILADPGPNRIASLYRRARVVADAAWISLGLSRLARAALADAALVVADHHYAATVWRGDGIWKCDAASERSIALALRDAWYNAERTVPIVKDRVLATCDQDRVFKTIVRSYAALFAQAAATP